MTKMVCSFARCHAKAAIYNLWGRRMKSVNRDLTYCIFVDGIGYGAKAKQMFVLRFWLILLFQFDVGRRNIHYLKLIRPECDWCPSIALKMLALVCGLCTISMY